MVAFVFVLITRTLEHLSHIWVELTLAILVAVAYFAFAGRAGKPKGSKSNQNPQQSKNVESCEDEQLTPLQLVTKALRQGRITKTISILEQMPEVIAGVVPNGLAQRLLMLLSRVPASSDALNSLQALTGKITSAPLEAALVDALNAKDVAACRQLHTLSNLLRITKSQQALQSLVQAYCFDAQALHVLVEEAAAPLAVEFAAAVLQTKAARADSGLVQEVMAKASDVEFLRAVLEKAMAVPRSSTPTTAGGSVDSDNSASPRSNQVAVITSLKDAVNGACPEKKTMSVKEIAMRANDIRSCGKNGDLRGAIKVFQRVGGQGEQPALVNSMLDACIACNDMNMAQEFFDEAKTLAVADAAIYNTMMKGYIANGREAAAKSLLAELSDKGMAGSRSSYHGLLNARINARDVKGAWKLVEEMQHAGISPNAVTCSILMKGRLNSLADVSRVLALVDAMDQPMDEVLFLSVVEGCIRTGQLVLLSKLFEKFLQECPAANLSAPTFGTMIKAYGQARDTKRVWALWNQMLAHQATPTHVTLGCMVEALVANGCASDAWQLTQKLWADEKSRSLVNTVIYSSILKGFAHNQETDKVMALYEEMKAHEIQPNTITYNTIFDAFARGGAMNRVASLLEDMKSANPPVEPDLVTYSTIVKGFCNSGSLDRALKVLKDMKASGKHAADEVMYNQLLSGCAKEHRPDEALQLLNDMKKAGVPPSNYTLSMLVKLMGRCKRLNQAFTMLEEISQEYGLKINVQVYTCLIQGCFNANQAAKGIAVHDTMIKEGLNPDAMTYTVLVRGCIQTGNSEKAVEFARCSYGLSTVLPQCRATPQGLQEGCLEELISSLGGPCNAAAEALMAELGDFQPAVSSKANGGNSRQARGFRPPRRNFQKGSDAAAPQGQWRSAGARVPGGQAESRAMAPAPDVQVAAHAPWRVAK